ncbi:hypothetical protein CLV59_106420 [Chitinophaga dinghuensis]|uniref:Uncharacterized protein n=1 Tax=Chitinophaga dinghuensis TaxID=1539050 RepID=A0A327VTX1_9BACT|nr:hypothetical protein CLV59_106420 [Chitinophaga dinghuensis]
MVKNATAEMLIPLIYMGRMQNPRGGAYTANGILLIFSLEKFDKDHPVNLQNH